jgi:glycosyltransferase involved in cell wall biosynthesis
MTLDTLDIVLPCYNPPLGWTQQVKTTFLEISEILASEASLTLILVNDGSKQGISDDDIALLKLEIPRFKYLSYNVNQGKGFALRTGMASAAGKFQIYTDIDFPYTVQSLLDIFKTLQTGKAAIAAGVRDANYYAHVPAIRMFISKFLRWLLKNFLRVKISDTQCGLKGFDAQGKALFLRTRIHRFLFDLEFIYLASGQSKLQLLPVLVELRPGIEFSKARMGILIGESLNFMSIFWRGLWERKRNKKAQ